MTDLEHRGSTGASAGWRARPAILALVGALAAVVTQQLIDRPADYTQSLAPLENWRIALSIAIGTGAMALGFGMERLRWRWSLAFALLVAAVSGLIYWWNGGTAGWDDFGDWRYASLFLSIAIMVPLFQALRDEGRWSFPYRDVHGHAWTNVVLWCACWFFVGIVFALAWLLAALFDLIGLHLVREMLERHWFSAALAGAAFGVALGLLRERDRVVRSLQRVATAVLAVLAPVLGAGLILFLLALPFTGLAALWEATRSTTPILLGCVIAALILANAVIGNGEDEETANPLLRWGAMALGVAILPLGVIAAIATGLRIAQYGFTPDRLWALVFVIFATVYGVAYLVSLVLGRSRWAALVRPANLRVAFVVAAVALFLATPILSFNAISTADHVARLETGRIKPDQFDWAALGYDFGDPGKAALRRLAASKNVAIAGRAAAAARTTRRYDAVEIDRTTKAAAEIARHLRVLPAGAAVPAGLRAHFGDWEACGAGGGDNCTLLYTPGDGEALFLKDQCVERLAAPAPSGASSAIVAAGGACVTRYRREGDAWRALDHGEMIRPDAVRRAALKAGLVDGKIEIRTVPRRQLFVGGVPVGDPFE